MDVTFFARGLAIGFAIAAPVGGIGLLCIRRTLADGRLAEFVSGLGAATADGCYGAIAALGLTAISTAIVTHQDAVHLAGGAFLCFLGARTAIASPARDLDRRSRSGRGLVSAYGFTLVLTLMNPTTILSFAALFAGLGLGKTAGDLGSAGLMVAGVFLGSALWWLILSGIVGCFRRALTPDRLRWVNRLSGALLLALGAVALVGVLH